ncbi:MAG: ATP-binding protein [Acidobacteriota bacterium]
MTTTFIADPDRDAAAVIRGFVYQVDVTIRRWLGLADTQILELERGEDIDIVARGIAAGEEEQRITEQVKSREANLTLRSPIAVQSVANFALHRERNPTLRLLFRFTTNALPGVEQNAGFPASLPGIIAWERVRGRSAGETEEAELAAALRAFYRDLPQADIADDGWQSLQRVVTSAGDHIWLDFLAAFEWSVASDAPALLPSVIREDLVAAGLADPSNAEEHYLRLFVHVFRLLTMDGEKSLTRQDLIDTLSRAADPTAHAQIAALLDRMSLLEQRMESTERRLSDVEETHRQMLEVAFSGMASLVATNAEMPRVPLGPITAASDPPTALAHQIARSIVVDRLRVQTPSGWLAIHGDTGSGKTQLAHLLAVNEGPSLLWLRLTDLSPFVAGAALRRFIEHATNLPPATQREALFSGVFQGTPPVRVIVLDDLPRLDSRSPFADDLLSLAKAAAGARALLISTSLHFLPPAISGALGESITEIVTPALTEAEVEEVLAVNGAPAGTAQMLATLIHTIGEGHVALVVGIAQYLRRQNWIITAEQLVRLLTGDHANGTRHQLLARLLASVMDEQTRQLLYRMMLAVGELTTGEIRGLADATPSIDAPLERLSQLEGMWVQVDGDDHIRVPPMVRLLRPDDLPREVQQFCYGRLAFMRMRRGTLSPLDVMKIVTYFVSGGLDYYAGLAIANGFMELERLGPVPDAGLSDFFMWPLPQGMPNGIKLFVRGTQLGMRLKWKKDVSFVLNDIDAIFAETSDAFEQSGVIIAAGKLLTGDPAEAWRALPLLRRAMLAHDEGARADLPVVPIPDSIWAESIILAGSSIGEEVGLRELQHTVEGLSPTRRAVLDARDDLEQMFVWITGNLFLSEHRKNAAVQDWQAVVDAMAALASWALRIDWPLLHAHATRMMIVVFGEYIHDMEQVISAGIHGVKQTTDARAQGIIEATVGRQLNLQNRWADSRQWYAHALSRPPSQIHLLHFDALVAAANAEQDFSLPAAIAYLENAVAVADSSDDLIGHAGQFSSRAELAIALLLNGDVVRALSLWDEAGAMLLAAEPADDAAKGRIRMFLQHSRYFYFVAAGLLAAMQLAPPEQRSIAPQIGQFHAELRAFGSQLDTFWRARVSIMLGKIAEARGDSERAKQCGNAALEAVSGTSDESATLRDEANRLAVL